MRFFDFWQASILILSVDGGSSLLTFKGVIVVLGSVRLVVRMESAVAVDMMRSCNGSFGG